MSDATLRTEILNLAQQSRKLPLVIPRHSDLATHAYRIKRNYDVAIAEARRRGLKL